MTKLLFQFLSSLLAGRADTTAPASRQAPVNPGSWPAPAPSQPHSRTARAGSGMLGNNEIELIDPLREWTQRPKLLAAVQDMERSQNTQHVFSPTQHPSPSFTGSILNCGELLPPHIQLAGLRPLGKDTGPRLSQSTDSVHVVTRTVQRWACAQALLVRCKPGLLPKDV